MKAIVPAAGQGTRLYPQTHTKPKAMVRLAGKPILGHILSRLADAPVDGVVIVVGGPMQQQIREYTRREFGEEVDLTFVEQESAEGLGHSVYQAEPVVAGEPVFIALGDMLFECGYDDLLAAHNELDGVDGSIGVKAVEEPSHYGVVSTDANGRITGLVEKPDDPPSDLAISGVYVVENSTELFETLGSMISADERGSGDEYQLTDALAQLVDDGAEFGTFEVHDWYDCGRPETLLEGNRVLLSELAENVNGDAGNVSDQTVIVPPVDIGQRATVEGSIVGPYVSIDEGTTVRGSIVRDSIVGRDADLESVSIQESIVGDNARVRGNVNRLNVGDNSSIEL